MMAYLPLLSYKNFPKICPYSSSSLHPPTRTMSPAHSFGFWEHLFSHGHLIHTINPHLSFRFQAIYATVYFTSTFRYFRGTSNSINFQNQLMIFLSLQQYLLFIQCCSMPSTQMIMAKPAFHL